MPQHRSFEVKANDGLNIELSLDRQNSDIVEKELASVVEEFDPLSTG